MLDKLTAITAPEHIGEVELNNESSLSANVDSSTDGEMFGLGWNELRD